MKSAPSLLLIRRRFSARAARWWQTRRHEWWQRPSHEAADGQQHIVLLIGRADTDIQPAQVFVGGIADGHLPMPLSPRHFHVAIRVAGFRPLGGYAHFR